MVVNLYIDTSIKGPKRKDGAYLYLLHAQLSAGPYERKGQGKVPSATEHHLTLRALTEALRRFSKPCRLHIYLEDSYVCNALANGWPEEWRYHGWMTARGKTVADAIFWNDVIRLLESHEYTLHLQEKHEYSEWMRWTIAMI